MKRFATLISHIFSPLLSIPLLVILYVLQVAPLDFWNMLTIFFGAGVFPVIVILVYLKQSGRISDWEMRRRQERNLFNLATIGIGVFLLLLLYIFQFTSFLALAIVLVVWFTVFSAITFFWKISAHTAGFTLLYLLQMQSTTFWQLVGLGVLILIAWSRVARRNHSFLQVVGGIGLSLVVFIIARALQLV